MHRKSGSANPAKGAENLLDRGKRSIALDLKDTNDVQLFKRIVAASDGLIEGFRPGVMERLGLGPSDLNEVCPALVYGRMTGWGQGWPPRTAGGARS